MRKRVASYIVYLSVLVFLSSCTAVKEYQKMYIDDAEMQLKSRTIEQFETNFAVYREGASGASGGKTGGGCGCN